MAFPSQVFISADGKSSLQGSGLLPQTIAFTIPPAPYSISRAVFGMDISSAASNSCFVDSNKPYGNLIEPTMDSARSTVNGSTGLLESWTTEGTLHVLLKPDVDKGATITIGLSYSFPISGWWPDDTFFPCGATVGHPNTGYMGIYANGAWYCPTGSLGTPTIDARKAVTATVTRLRD